MAANLFGRYVWLIEQFRRHGRLTYEEVNHLWQKSGLSYGDGDELALRTFHNHRKAIFDIFDVEIACDTKDGYRYYINYPENLENDPLRIWLIDSYTALNQIQADQKLKGRILFENVPSGHQWLHTITDAMRNNQVLRITHQGFGKPEPVTFDIEPYYLKVAKRRWYVLARSPYYSERNLKKNKADGGNRTEDVFRVYALDRILDCYPTGGTFKMKENFDIEKYFRGCCGIIPSNSQPVRVVIKAYPGAQDFLRTLPLHESQREISYADRQGVRQNQERCLAHDSTTQDPSKNSDLKQGRNDQNSLYFQDNEATYFELHVCPTFDLYQTLLEQADQIEVVEPEPVRDQMRTFIKNMMGYYERE